MTELLPHTLLRLRAQIWDWLDLRDLARAGASPSSLALSRRAQVRIVAVLAAATMVVIAVAATAHVLSSYWDKSDTHDDAVAAPGTFRPTPVQLANLKIEPVTTEPFQTEQITDGRIAIDEDRATQVFSPISGRISKVYVRLGDTVAEGAPLFTIDSPEFAQAQNDFLTTFAQLTLARANEARQRALYEAKGAALKDWQQSQSDLTAAKAAADAAQNRLRILGKSPADMRAMEDGSLRKELGAEAVIRAPIAGRVLSRKINPGEYMQAGASDPVLVIGDLSKLWLVANVPEAASGAMRVGEQVKIRVPAYPDRVFEASVTYVAPEIDPATHRLPVRADIDNLDGALKPEMFASFVIRADDTAVRPSVPEQAVVYDGSEARVWVQNTDGSLSARPIRLGRSQDGRAEVVEGLVAGDRIVTHGTLFIDRATSFN